MEKHPKISVIVPVYNSQKYLRECLNTLTLQTYENIEIICIDDGSKDGSLKILEEYSQKDDRIKVLSQKNAGQSSARNKGLLLAKGEYVSFIDSDDVVSLLLYEKFVNALNSLRRDIDIYMFNGDHFYKRTNTPVSPKFFVPAQWKNREKKEIFTLDDCQNPFGGNLSAVNKIYNVNFLKDNEITFETGKIFEDQLFSIETFINADSIFINNDILYHYRHFEHFSTMNTLNGKKIRDIFYIINKIEDVLKAKEKYEEYKYALFQHKFRQFSFLFFKTELKGKAAFYDEIKERLRCCYEDQMNKEICKKLSGFDIFNDIMNLNWFKFYLKYKDTAQI